MNMPHRGASGEVIFARPHGRRVGGGGQLWCGRSRRGRGLSEKNKEGTQMHGDVNESL